MPGGAQDIVGVARQGPEPEEGDGQPQAVPPPLIQPQRAQHGRRGDEENVERAGHRIHERTVSIVRIMSLMGDRLSSTQAGSGRLTKGNTQRKYAAMLYGMGRSTRA